MGRASHHCRGRALHEAPDPIPGYLDAADTRMLHEGMVIAIEPFLSTESRRGTEAADGWTRVGDRGGLSAPYGHTTITTRAEPIVVTRH